MKRFYFPFILVLLMIISCGRNENLLRLTTQALKNRKPDTTQITVVKEYFSNKALKAEIETKGNLRHGKTKNYDRFGHLLSEVNYKYNQREGKVINYYPTGEISSTLFYKNDIKQGDEIWFYKNGLPYRVTPYINGNSSGIQKYYYENGKIMAEVPVKNGNPGMGLKEYHEDGSVITDYPHLIIQQKNYADKITFIVKLSKPGYEFKLYEGPLDAGKYLFKGLYKMEMKDGFSRFDINIPQGSSIDVDLIVSARIKTKLGNPLVLSKSRHITAVNNN